MYSIIIMCSGPIVIGFIMPSLLQINRTSELARVFGIDFFSVLSRGSQYRVESMVLRLAHTQNYLAISPGKQQVWLGYITWFNCFILQILYNLSACFISLSDTYLYMHLSV